MDALTDAVEAYSELEQQHPDEPADFIAAIHRLQDLLAVRLARRLYPDGWVTYGPQENAEVPDGPSETQRQSGSTGAGFAGRSEESSPGQIQGAQEAEQAKVG
jgi:hypothetical protein